MSTLDQKLAEFSKTEQKHKLNELARVGQSPSTIVVACADSRVAPEVIFGAELGELFVIRVAGNVIGPLELASIEYAAVELGVADCVVIGHTQCGAVSATLGCVRKDQPAPTEALQVLVDTIAPAVRQASGEVTSGAEDEIAARAIELNATRMAGSITAQSSPLASVVKDGKLKIRAAVFDMANSELKWLED